MDREQEEIQFLGFFGIFKESCNILSSWARIFTQITVTVIVPLAAIYLAHIEISHLLFTDIMRDGYILNHTIEGTRSYDRVSAMLSSDLAKFALFKAVYILFFTILALLSTAAVVYAVACIYTAREITFRAVVSVVPRVWRRLLVTFAWNFAIVFAYNMASLVALIIGVLVVGQVEVVVIVYIIVFFICYFVGLFYITLVWQLASVVSVLEEKYGLGAMRKSRDLIRGKMVLSSAVFLVLVACFIGIQTAFGALVVRGGGIGGRIGFGGLFVVMMAAVMVFTLVAQTILYLVCKSYHHENIDKSTLSDHLGGYLGEYVPLKSKDVQLNQYELRERMIEGAEKDSGLLHIERCNVDTFVCRGQQIDIEIATDDVHDSDEKKERTTTPLVRQDTHGRFEY